MTPRHAFRQEDISTRNQMPLSSTKIKGKRESRSVDSDIESSIPYISNINSLNHVFERLLSQQQQLKAKLESQESFINKLRQKNESIFGRPLSQINDDLNMPPLIVRRQACTPSFEKSEQPNENINVDSSNLVTFKPGEHWIPPKKKSKFPRDIFCSRRRGA